MLALPAVLWNSPSSARVNTYGLSHGCPGQPVPLCNIVKDRGQARTLSKSHFEFFGHEDPVSMLHGNLSVLECCCERLVSVRLTPYCTRRFNSSLNHTLLYASSRSTAMASLFFPLIYLVGIA